ncbi:MAG: hypothetical protein H6925_06090 [Holosporaceae bacterium]|nr:MAG: hypothetical protein H6925_06090 [Holosporaceae bacterium]
MNGLEKRKSNKDFLLKADQVSHEQDLQIIIARGNVRISDGIEIVEADMVSYNQKTETISASGNVLLWKKMAALREQTT